MKDLLYLKDQIKVFIQLYYAYRETFSDPRELLSKKFWSTFRALHLIERNPGINLVN